MQQLSIITCSCIYDLCVVYQLGLRDMLVDVVTAHHRYTQEPFEVSVESP